MLGLTTGRAHAVLTVWRGLSAVRVAGPDEATGHPGVAADGTPSVLGGIAPERSSTQRACRQAGRGEERCESVAAHARPCGLWVVARTDHGGLLWS